MTVRGTINVIIATRCLVDGFCLLHSDRDFDAFEAQLGLQGGGLRGIPNDRDIRALCKAQVANLAN